MDTISRENNSMLPIGAVIVGVLGLIVAGIAVVSVQGVKKSLAEQQEKIASVESASNAAAASATQASDKVAKNLAALNSETQRVVNEIGQSLANHAERLTKIEEAAKKPVPAAGGKKGGEPVTAGPGEYIVKAGDASGAKIARDHGVSLADLQAVNPSINWNKLKIGDKLKLPSTAGKKK